MQFRKRVCLAERRQHWRGRVLHVGLRPFVTMRRCAFAPFAANAPLRRSFLWQAVDWNRFWNTHVIGVALRPRIVFRARCRCLFATGQSKNIQVVHLVVRIRIDRRVRRNSHRAVMRPHRLVLPARPLFPPSSFDNVYDLQKPPVCIILLCDIVVLQDDHDGAIHLGIDRSLAKVRGSSIDVIEKGTRLKGMIKCDRGGVLVVFTEENVDVICQITVSFGHVLQRKTSQVGFVVAACVSRLCRRRSFFCVR